MRLTDVHNIKYFENLDGLRFLSAFGVLLFHKINNLPWEFSETHGVYYRAVGFFTRNGFLGVNFFFVLSGFLITWLIIKEIEFGDKFDYPKFIIRRILRIWPLYFLIVFLSFVFFEQQSGIGYYLSFLSNVEVIYKNSLQTGVAFPLWSVSIEEQFYVLVPLIIFLFKPKGLNFYVLLYTTIIVISIVYQILNIENINKIHYSTISCATNISVGGLLAAFSFYKSGFTDIRTLNRLGLQIIIYIIGLLYITFRVYLTLELKVVEHLFISVFFAYVIYDQLFAEKSIIKIKNIPLINNLGKYTYAFYLFHMVVLLTLHEFWETMNIIDNVFIDIFVKTMFATLLTLLLTRISYRVIEKPLLDYKTRRFSSRS